MSDSSKFVNNKTVTVMGMGYKGGQPKFGVEDGPRVLREAGIVQAIRDLGWTVTDAGDLSFDPFRPEEDPPTELGVKNPRTVGNACKKIFEEGSVYAMKGNARLNLGGDHSVAIGTIASSCKAWKDTVVVWVDAHADINTPAVSPSGNIHGMPVAFLMGLDSKGTTGFDWLSPCLTADRIVYIGLRDVDSGERRILKEQNIKAFSMREVDKYGIGHVMEKVIEFANGRPIHLTFDVDGIDPTVVPSTGTRVEGGLTFREARHICETIAESGQLVALDVVEVNPSLGSPQDVKLTASVGADLARFAFGHSLL